MLGQRLRHWPNIEPALNEWTMFERKSSCPATQDICITFIQRRPNVLDAGPPLPKLSHTNVLCLLGISIQAWVKQFQHRAGALG